MAIRIRDGSRSFLNAAELCCKFSRMRGFTNGLASILGPTPAGDLLEAFGPFCTVVDALVAADNWFNQKDLDPTGSPGNEDIGPE